MFKKFTKRNILVAALCGILLAGLTVTVIEYVYATSQHLNLLISRGAVNGVGYLEARYKWVNATDTVFVPFSLPRQSPTVPVDTLIGTLVVRTQNVANTNAQPSLMVRWQYSMDNSNWQGTTIGTDSTTWATATWDSANNTTNDGNTYKTTTVSIGQIYQNSFWMPYNRILVAGKAANSTNRAIIDFIPH